MLSDLVHPAVVAAQQCVEGRAVALLGRRHEVGVGCVGRDAVGRKRCDAAEATQPALAHWSRGDRGALAVRDQETTVISLIAPRYGLSAHCASGPSS